MFLYGQSGQSKIQKKIASDKGAQVLRGGGSFLCRYFINVSEHSEHNCVFFAFFGGKNLLFSRLLSQDLIN